MSKTPAHFLSHQGNNTIGTDKGIMHVSEEQTTNVYGTQNNGPVNFPNLTGEGIRGLYLPPGNILHYKMDADDLADGVNTPLQVWGPGVEENLAIQFDGVDQYLDKDADASKFTGIEDAFTIAFWFRTDQTTPSATGTIMHLGNSDAGSTGFSIEVEADGNVEFRSNGFTTDCTARPGLDRFTRWHHALFTFDGTTRTWYIDNIASGSENESVNEFNSSNFKIGRTAALSTEFINGEIDEILVYPRVLTEAERTDVYNYSSYIRQDPVIDALVAYKLDGTDPNVVRVGGDDFRQGPAAPDTKAQWGDGATQYQSADADISLINTIANGGMSFSLWVNTTVLEYSVLLDTNNYGSTSNSYRLACMYAGNLRMKITNVNHDSTTSVNDGRWHHVVLTSSGSGGTYIFYLDGIPDGTGTIAAYDINGLTKNIIGASIIDTLHFDGGIDDVRVFDRALTPLEISKLSAYRNDWTPADVSPAQQIAWYDPQDQTTITESAGAVSDLTDKYVKGQDLEQTVGGQEPITGTDYINGINVLDYDGVDDYLVNAAFEMPASGNSCFVIVGNAEVVSGQYESMISISDSNDFQLDASNGTKFKGRLNNNVGSNPKIEEDMTNINIIITLIADYDNNTLSIYRDGTLKDTKTDYDSPFSTSQELNLMVSRSLANFLDGICGQIVIAENTTQAIIDKLNGEAAWKYGLVANLPADHTYKTTPPRTWS